MKAGSSCHEEPAGPGAASPALLGPARLLAALAPLDRVRDGDGSSLKSDTTVPVPPVTSLSQPALPQRKHSRRGLHVLYVLQSNCAGRAVKTLLPLAERQEHKARHQRISRTSILMVCLSPTVLMSSTLPPRPDMPRTADRPKPRLGSRGRPRFLKSSGAPSPGFHATCPPAAMLVE